MKCEHTIKSGTMYIYEKINKNTAHISCNICGIIIKNQKIK